MAFREEAAGDVAVVAFGERVQAMGVEREAAQVAVVAVRGMAALTGVARSDEIAGGPFGLVGAIDR